MLVHIFRGTGRVFGCTEDGTGANLPAKFSPWTAFKSIDLSRGGEPRAGVDSNECLEDIEKHGFHITDAHVRITESALWSIVAQPTLFSGQGLQDSKTALAENSLEIGFLPYPDEFFVVNIALARHRSAA
jgi:hypothetical protein